LETLNTNEADEFGAVLNSVRYTFRYKIDVIFSHLQKKN